MWKGTAPSLNASATTMNTTASATTTLSPAVPASAPRITESSSDPVSPYNRDMPYSRMLDARAPSTKYFIADSTASLSSR